LAHELPPAAGDGIKNWAGHKIQVNTALIVLSSEVSVPHLHHPRPLIPYAISSTLVLNICVFNRVFIVVCSLPGKLLCVFDWIFMRASLALIVCVSFAMKICGLPQKLVLQFS